MQKKQATGEDTRAMLPLFVSLFIFLCSCAFPWISIPVLIYSKVQTTYTFWNIELCIRNIQGSIRRGGMLHMELFSETELDVLCNFSVGIKIIAGILMIWMLLCGTLSYVKKKKALFFVKICFLFSALAAAGAFVTVSVINVYFNTRMGRPSTFLNMTLHSYVQLTAWQYAQFILSVLMLLSVNKLLDTEAEYKTQTYIDRSVQADRHIGKRTWAAMLLILIAIPFVIFFGIFFLNDRSEIFISLCIIGLAMIPFAMVFEQRRPQARELLLIAVMAAIAVVGRMAFFMIPQFKPVVAIVIIAGVGLGAEAGFLTGAMTGFVSNFFFGQGPWTPWQMFSFGIIGFLAGLLFSKNKKRNTSRAEEWKHKIILCIYGGLSTFIIYGLLMDTASVTMVGQDLSWKAFLAAYVSGVPFNINHGTSTVIFLFFLSIPMERKLDRIKKKYGILEV